MHNLAEQIQKGGQLCEDYQDGNHIEASPK
jgi:hypothetical protein